jgi:hypothetical protein
VRPVLGGDLSRGENGLAPISWLNGMTFERKETQGKHATPRGLRP